MRSLAILTYHSLDDSGSVLSVAPKVFAAQMACLAGAGWQVLSLSGALAERQALGRWPDRRVVVTFDDGFGGVYDHALPVLRQHGQSATVFLASGLLEAPARPGSAGPAAPSRPPGRRMLSWAQVRELEAAGFEIGAHTASHVDLTAVPAQQAEGEMAASVQAVAECLGRLPVTFAYPFGRTNPAVTAIARRLFQASCTTVHRRANDNDPLESLPRVEMYYFRTCTQLGPLAEGSLDTALAWRRGLRAVRQILACSHRPDLTPAELLERTARGGRS